MLNYIIGDNMKKKTLIICIVVCVLLGVGSILLYFGYKNIKAENDLRKEVDFISNMSADNYEESKKRLETYVSSGEYLVVEKAVKKYMLDVLNTYNDFNIIMKDEKITNILSIENLKNDGPDFKDTKVYMENTKKKVIEIKDKFSDYLNEKIIMDYIKNENLSESKVKLYKDLTLGKENDFESTKKELETAIDNLVELFNKEEKVIDFLTKNQSNYEIKDGTVYFYEDELVSEYNSLLKDISNMGK